MNVLIVALDRRESAEVSEAEVLVVAPALNSRLRRWLSDEDEARRHAQERAAAIVDLLREAESASRVASVTPIRCWRSRMHCRPFRPTRS